MEVFFAQIAQAVAPIESFTATSIMGWGGFVFGLGAFGILIWDRVTGRTRSIVGLENKIDKLTEKFDDFEVTQGVMDKHLKTLSDSVRDLTFEWKGVEGANGARAVIRQHGAQLRSLEDWRNREDFIAERERELGRGQRRRARDRLDDAGEGAET